MADILVMVYGDVVWESLEQSLEYLLVAWPITEHSKVFISHNQFSLVSKNNMAYANKIKAKMLNAEYTNFIFKTGLNVVTSLMALCATAMGTAACVLNENWAIDDYVYISIYGLEGIFLFSKSQILKNFLLHSKKAKKLKSFITSFLL